ncbi:UNKNOWN [Stylonychia lemnae]|uniref:Cadg domain containing protein n=1 Tax=Stylonychia lemnae TaxID=5949 RepID=A0A078AH47_STYLE|nr:UNKNOWN [Stylonychia lemnae]|eukprot:CDW81605.1 UNKNOWN [Stylonychia lemnae]
MQYPIFYNRGSNGDTVFLTIDEMDGVSAIGGYSSDSSLVAQSSLPNPILLVVNGQGTVQWIKTFDDYFDSVTSLDISSSGDKVYFALDTNNAQNLIISSVSITDGSSLSAYQFGARGIVKPDSIIATSNNVYVALQYNSKYAFMKYSQSSPSSTQFYKYLGNDGSYAGGVYLYKDIYFTYGYVKKSSSVVIILIILFQAFATIISFEDDNYKQDFVYSQSSTPYYGIDKLKIDEDDDKYYAWTCGAKSDNTDVMINRINLDNNKNFQTGTFYSATRCVQIHMRSDSKVYFLFYKQSMILTGYIDITKNDDNKIDYLRLTSIDSDSNNVLYHGQYHVCPFIYSIFKASGNFYFVGSVRTLTSYSGSGLTGRDIGIYFLTNTLLSQIKIPYETSDSPAQLYTYVNSGSCGNCGINKNQLQSDIQSETVWISSYPLTASSKTNTLQQIDSANPTYTITSDLQDRTYTVGSDTEKYSVDDFSINGASSCSDKSFTYEIITGYPSFVSPSSSSNKEIEVSTSSETDIGEYTIQVKVTINNGQTFTGSFKLTIKSKCSSVSITKSSISAQTYYVSQPYLSIQFSSFSLSPSNSGCTITYTLSLSDGQAYDSSFIRTFSTTNRTIIVYTQDISKASYTAYSLKLTGSLTNYPAEKDSITFSLTIKSCFWDTLSISPSITQKTHYAKQSTTVTSNLATITVSQSFSGLCPTPTYSLMKINSSNTEVAADMIFSLSANVLTLITTDNTMIGEYTLKVYAKTIWETTTYKEAYNTFTVTILDYCDNSAQITAWKPGEQTYYISSNLKTIQFDIWTSTLAVSDCPITYSSSIPTAIQSVVTFSPTDRQFTIAQTNNMILLGTYSVSITGYLTSINSYTVSFDIIFKNPCEKATINIGATQIADQTYDLNSIQSPNPYTFDEFYSSITLPSILAYCGTLTYKFKDASGSDLDSTIFTASSASRSVTIFTSDESKLANSPYTVTVKGYYSNFYYPSASFTFKVNLQKNCFYQSATLPAAQSQTYMLTDSQKTINPGLFSLLFTTGCPLVYTYTCQLQIDNSPCLTPNPFITSFESSTGIFKVYSTSATTGVYLIKIKGSVVSTQDSGTYTSSELIITLTISPLSCLLEPPTTLIDPIKVYSLGTTLDIPYNEFIVSVGTCNTQYTLYQDSCTSGTQLTAGSGATLETVVSLDTTNKKIIVRTSDQALAGKEFVICLIGKDLSTISEATQTFTLRISCCQVTALTPSSLDTSTSSLTSQTYFINQGTMDIPFHAFTEATTTGTTCGFTITYQLSVVGYSSIPSFISLTSSTNPLSLTVTSNQKQDVLKSPYTVLITSSVNNPGVATPITGQLSIPLVITQQNLAAPKFIPSLQDISLKVEDTTDLVFADPIDTDGDGFTVSTPKFGQASFVSGSYPNFILQPKFSDLGEYKVQVTVTDDNINSLSATYSFIIKVSKSASENNNSTNATSNDTTGTGTSLNSGTSQTISIKQAVIKDKKSTKLTAEIKEISIKGLITVTFNSDVIVPTNYTNFDSKVMLIQVRDEEGKTDKSINYTWNLTCQERCFEIIEIRQYGYIQLYNIGATAALAENGGSGVSALSSFMYGSLALNVIMYLLYSIITLLRAASLSMLWGMVNVLQLIINMPLMNVSFPMNAVFFYNLLMDMANFDLLPSKEIESGVFEFEDSTTPPQFQMMDIFLTLIYQIRHFNQKYAMKQAMLYKIQEACLSTWFASLLAIMLVCLSITFPFLIMVLLIPNQNQLQDKKYSDTYGALYADIRTNSKLPLFFNVIYVGRRIIFAGVAIIGQNHPFFQIQALIFHCLFIIMFLIIVKPFQKSLNNYLEILNEICILGASYHLLVLTDYTPDDDIQYMAGWSLIGITVFNMLINIFVMVTLSLAGLIMTIKELKEKCKEFIKKKKASKYSQDSKGIDNLDQQYQENDQYMVGLLENSQSININMTNITEGNSIYISQSINNSKPLKKDQISKRRFNKKPQLVNRESLNELENTNDDLIGKLAPRDNHPKQKGRSRRISSFKIDQDQYNFNNGIDSFKLEEISENDGIRQEQDEIAKEMLKLYKQKQESLMSQYNQLNQEISSEQLYDSTQNNRRKSKNITVREIEKIDSQDRQIHDDLIMNINFNNVNYETPSTSQSITKLRKKSFINDRKASSSSITGTFNSKTSRFNNKNKNSKVGEKKDKIMDDIIVESLDLEQNQDIMTLKEMKYQRNDHLLSQYNDEKHENDVTSSLEVHIGQMHQMMKTNPQDQGKQDGDQKLFKKSKRRIRMKTTL